VLCDGNDQANQDKQRNDSNEGHDGEPLKPTWQSSHIIRTPYRIG
jgi:hypothetical protein